MGCAASSDDGAERRRALGQSEASIMGPLAVGQDQDQDPSPAAARGRWGGKVAPEPTEKEDPAPVHAMPGSPSFRHYCQKKEAAVDALVAESEAIDRNGSVRITVAETSEAPKTNELTTVEDTSSKTKIFVERSKPKQVTKWLTFRGLAIVAAWYNLFGRHKSKASTTPPSPADAKSHPPAPAPAATSN